MQDRLTKQMNFLNEVEQLKLIYRQNRTVDQSRFENSAEHSWHVTLMAMVLLEHADDRSSINPLRVANMLVIHDLVEVYAGDTWLYDEDDQLTQTQREAAAAEKLYKLLPDDQAVEWRSLWEEFEERKTADAKYASAIDALQPLTNHLCGHDESAPKIENRPHREDVLARKEHIAEASRGLWAYAKQVVIDSADKGLYR